MNIKCEICDGYYVLRHGKFGLFTGCSNFPRCLSKMGLAKLVQIFFQIHGVNVYRWDRICFKCNNKTPIYSYFLYYDLAVLGGGLGNHFRSRHGIGLGDLRSIDKRLEDELSSIKMRYSKTIKESYVANICIHCGVTQGYQYTVSDPHEIFYELILTRDMEKYLYKTLRLSDPNAFLRDIQPFFMSNQQDKP